MGKMRRHWPQIPEFVADFNLMRENLKEIPRGKGFVEVNEWLQENRGYTISRGTYKWVTSGYQRHEDVYEAISAKATEFKVLRKVKQRIHSQQVPVKIDLDKLELV